MSDPEKYTVGWICAITTEFVAARAFLDEEHDGPCQVAQHDNNSYVLGKIGNHNVVIAVLPDVEYGIASAAAVARDMLHSFPNVRIGLMVGIGGGAPSRKRDVRLGDVVVSSRDGGQGGVFQYDYGKTIQNQSFQETGFLDPPPMVLRTAMSKLKSTYEMEGHKLVDDVDRALKKIKKRKKYTRPPPESDRLYRSDVVHPAHSADGCDVTCGNDEANLVVRVERDEEEDDPAIHYGLIASGNQLIKDALIRDKLADDRGVLCFEMESAGLMNHFPCLVIRGICDYSDSHKNKEWQGFAAMMAAAYSRDLLHQIPANKIQEERRISEVLGLIREDLGHLHQTAKEAKTIVATSRLERWLRPPDTSTNFNQARKKWHEGSGQWFLDSATFNEWKHGSRRHLWLYGLAGCGKTILSTTIVDHLQKMNDCFVLEFYFDFNDTVKQQVDGLSRSLLFQLYKFGSHPEHLDNLYKSCQDGQRQPDGRTLLSCLHTMIKGSKAIFVILDALDECTERRDLLECLKEFFTTPDLSHARLLATSRPEEEFLSFIPSWLGKEHCLQLDKDAVDNDIRSYVEARLEHSPEFVSKRLSKDLFEQIRKQIGNRADGMFRWAACQLDSFAVCMSPRAIEKALESLPRDLDETYRRMLRSIPVDIEKDAIRLLQFLVHTKRPLAVSEVVEVIATQADEVPQSFDAKRRLFRETDVLRYCPSLVSLIEVSKGYKTRKELHLAHFSVKEYLLKQDQFDLTSSCIVMTKTCLSYLTDIEGDSSKMRQDFPLARYATMFWTDYATSAETSGEVVQAIVKFLQNEVIFERWCRLGRRCQHAGRLLRQRSSSCLI
ncbi:vegetative incompatibility protein HET-E-1 [Corynascus novoguineensis]|uniref:Vegetative incompatibility protein HET-E-1 n=1 Tax=Corynascus novoguineensis TaxID=1126955 RepID=A0AAN7CLI7_9PEZI|nr:vegetative incompatibility protein HET-E-1 [Corynascus novoguineensis]